MNKPYSNPIDKIKYTENEKKNKSRFLILELTPEEKLKVLQERIRVNYGLLKDALRFISCDLNESPDLSRDTVNRIPDIKAKVNAALDALEFNARWYWDQFDFRYKTSIEDPDGMKHFVSKADKISGESEGRSDED